MTQHYFRISSGLFAGSSDCVIELTDRAAAWQEIANTAADLLPSIWRNLNPSASWSMELLNETTEPIAQIQLIAADLS